MMKIKICGMRDPGNVSEIVRLKPDYIGFILYRHSPRFIEPEEAGKLKSLIPASIQKVGVIVDEPLDSAIKLAMTGNFDILQLHGNEDVNYCRSLSVCSKIIKAFRISGSLPPDLAEYQPYCSLFLFDAAGKNYGGNGTKFDHRLLEDYNLDTRFILGGGIAPQDCTMIRNISSEKLEGIDLNSRFEIMPGIKDPERLRKFMNKIREQ